jgi:hypothetical protein
MQFEIELSPFESACCHFQTADGLRERIEPFSHGVVLRGRDEVPLFDLE